MDDAESVSHADSKRIIVTRLSGNIRSAHVHEIFSAYGAIKTLEMPTFRLVGTHRGFAFVEFEEHVFARLAVTCMNSGQIDGNVVTVEFAKDFRRERDEASRKERDRLALERNHERRHVSPRRDSRRDLSPRRDRNRRTSPPRRSVPTINSRYLSPVIDSPPRSRRHSPRRPLSPRRSAPRAASPRRPSDVNDRRMSPRRDTRDTRDANPRRDVQPAASPVRTRREPSADRGHKPATRGRSPARERSLSRSPRRRSVSSSSSVESADTASSVRRGRRRRHKSRERR